MATRTITIIGDEAVMKRLSTLEAKVKAVLPTAMMAGALIIQTQAKNLVRKKTGNLARSIHTEQLPGGLGVQIGTNVVYAAAQEFGRPDLPAYGYTPYLRPATDQNISRVASTIGIALGKLVAV